MSLWSRVRALFGEAEQSDRNNPIVHSTLARHRDSADEFAAWKRTVVALRLRDWLADQYAAFLTDPTRVDRGIDFLDTPSSKGFVIHFGDTQYTLREAEFFQLYLRERVMQHEYRTQVADSKTYAYSGGSERTDRYYLKPRPDWSAPEGHEGGMNTYTKGQFNQQFGNILIELVVRNEKPWRLKFSATIYHDRVYQKAQAFGALMDLVLS